MLWTAQFIGQSADYGRLTAISPVGPCVRDFGGWFTSGQDSDQIIAMIRAHHIS